MKSLRKPLRIILLMSLMCLLLCMAAFAADAELIEADAVTEATVEENASAFLLDLDDAEHPEELAAMIDKGYIVGYSDGSFRPGRSYTRVELAQLVTALCELETDASALPAFYDTEIFAKDAIDSAVSNGLMSGRNDTSFDPYGEVLKAELVGTLEKAAFLLGIENYAELLGDEDDWASDYTICTAAEAMHAAYVLDTAVTEARDAALKDAAALLAAMTSEEPVVELVFEPAEEIVEESDDVSEDSAETEEAPAEDTEEVPEETDEAAAEVNAESSGEPSEEASGEASAEPKDEKPTEQSAPPAGVTTPAGAQSAQQQAPAAPAAPAATAQTETVETLEGEHIIIQKVVDFYNMVRNNIVDLLSGLVG